MKKYNIRFERDPSLHRIEVIVRAPQENEDVRELMNRLTDHEPNTLVAFDGNGNVRPIVAERIISASVEGKLISLVTQDGVWYTRQSLQSLEAALDKRRFVRISRYELINLNHVIRYDFTVAGTLRVELAGGMETWASRRCIPAIRRKLAGKE